jgi:ferredoxin-nitrite reductase
MSADFTPEQKRYLEGFLSGIQATRTAACPPAKPPTPVPSGPDAAHLNAQDVTEARGGKLADQEKWKREEHPFDAYTRFKAQAEGGEYPKPADNFRWRYFGLFYVAPAQSNYMCRLRIPNGVLTHWQFAGMADVADRLAGGFAHVTTRANLQIREIAAEAAAKVVEAIQDLGLCSRGSGADNIRNVTGDATAGIVAQELLDTRPYARDWHFHILNDRGLYGLPRKFNVAFDGGGPIPTLEETNDIGFQAVRIGEGAGVEPGIWFRLMLGGITGHRDLARDTGIIVEPGQATRVADAIVRVFIAKGDRTNRNKARLKYVLDDWGFDTFINAVEDVLGAPLQRVEASYVEPRPAQDRLAHVGIHEQAQDDRHYIGIVLPVGRMTSDQMRALAALAQSCGDGDLRLTVWQNLLISGVPSARLEEAQSRIEACGLDWRASSIRAGLVACTGSTGCKFAAADTKGSAEQIARWCDTRVRLDVPVNIHVTGCHHSCAQHYIGDIGLIGARVPINDDGDTEDAFDVVVGGGFGTQAAIGRDLAKGISAREAPAYVEGLLRTYLAHRIDRDESFHAFTSRVELEDLQRLMGEVEA